MISRPSARALRTVLAAALLAFASSRSHRIALRAALAQATAAPIRSISAASRRSRRAGDLSSTSCALAWPRATRRRSPCATLHSRRPNCRRCGRAPSTSPRAPLSTLTSPSRGCGRTRATARRSSRRGAARRRQRGRWACSRSRARRQAARRSTAARSPGRARVASWGVVLTPWRARLRGRPAVRRQASSDSTQRAGRSSRTRSTRPAPRSSCRAATS